MNADNVRLLVSTCITYGHLGYLNLENEELICLYDECLIVSQYFGDSRTVLVSFSAIQLYMLLAEVKEKMHCFEESSKYFNQMLKLTEQEGCELVAEIAFLSMAARYTLLCNLKKAVECYQQIINISKKQGFKHFEAMAYWNLEEIYNKFSKYHESKLCSENCVKIGKEIRDTEFEVGGYLHLGTANFNLGKWNDAILSWEEAIKIALSMDNKKPLGAAYLEMGRVHQKLGKLDKAQEYLGRSLRNAREIGDRGQEATSYGILGNVYRILGKHQEAMDCYQRSLSISTSMGDKENIGTQYTTIGALYFTQGKYHKAIQYYENALKVFKDIGNRMKQGEIYSLLAGVYNNVGQLQDSLENHNKGLAIAIQTGNKKFQVESYRGLGTVYYNFTKKYEKAMEYYVKCLNCALEIGDKMEEGNAYCNIGYVHLRLSNLGEAIEYFEKSTTIAKSMKNKHGEGRAYLGLGEVCYCIKKYDEAIRCSEKSLDVAIKFSDKSMIGRACHLLGLVYYAQSEYGEEGEKEKHREAKQRSEEKLKEALECWEWELTHLKDLNEFKISIVDRFIETYKMLTKVLIERQKTDEALLISDRGRARSLGGILVTKYGITEERAPSQTPLDSTGLECVLSRSNQFCILFFAMGYKDLHAWVLTHQIPIVLVNTNSQALTAVESVELEKGVEVNIEKIVINVVNEFYREMPREMETNRCENRSFDSTADSRLPRVGSQIQPKESLVHSVERNVDLVVEPQMNVTRQKADPLEVLFSLLFTPVIQHLQQEEIVIIPDGPLYMVPFAALRDPATGKYLSETKSIRISPSLATLKALRECTVDYHSKTGALIVGDPDVGEVIFKGETKKFDRLPSAKREADVIAALLNTKSLTGSQATKEMVKKELQEGVAVIHIAAHGDSEHGHIALAPPPRTDGASIPEEEYYMLTMEEVLEIGVTAQLVVLSCCHSGRGDIKAEGVVGISRAFLAAGARAVVASLWAVDDDATLRFMSSFYASLKMGESASKSLQIAMDDIRAEEGRQHPKYWAPFFLIGDDVTISV